jgi:hypothetical protein
MVGTALVVAFTAAALVVLLGPMLYLTFRGIKSDQHTPQGLT